MIEFKTLKAAYEAGFQHQRDECYGGEEIKVKGHVLHRNSHRAKSKTEWGREGRTVIFDAEPHSWVKPWQFPAYPIFRHDQTKPKARRAEKPAETISSITSAVWAINRAAKRQRDTASKQYANDQNGFAAVAKQKKNRLYELKAQALHYLAEEGAVSVVGYHKFGGNFAEVLSDGVYTFHRPCDNPQTDVVLIDLCQIESKTREASEPRLKDAIHTIEQYLIGKPRVKCYEWPLRYQGYVAFPRLYEQDHDGDYRLEASA